MIRINLCKKSFLLNRLLINIHKRHMRFTLTFDQSKYYYLYDAGNLIVEIQLMTNLQRFKYLSIISVTGNIHFCIDSMECLREFLISCYWKILKKRIPLITRYKRKLSKRKFSFPWHISNSSFNLMDECMNEISWPHQLNELKAFCRKNKKINKWKVNKYSWCWME